MPSQTTVVTKLALARYMLRMVDDQRRLPEPLCGLAVMTIHDAVELFLNLACEAHGGTKSSQEFMSLFDSLERATGTPVQHKEGMRRLNKARVNAKHFGTFPSKSDLRDFAETAEEFFRDNSQALFNLDFDSVTLSVLVSDPDVSRCIRDGGVYRDKGELEDALVCAAEAFARIELMIGTEPRPRGRQLFVRRTFSEQIMGTVSEQLAKAMGDLASRVWVLEHGIDRDEMQYFVALVPHVGFSVDGERYEQSRQRQEPLHFEEVDFCLSFVLRLALSLQEADAALPSLASSIGRRRFPDV